MFSLEKSKNGEITLKYNDKYIHSKYDPIKEAQVFAKANIPIENVNTIVVYGLGLGYHIKSLAELMNDKTIMYVFEYNDEIVRFCKEVNREIFEDKRIKIIDKSKSDFFGEFSRVLKNVNNIIIHRTSLETIKTQNSRLYNLINDFNIIKQYENIDIESIEQSEKNYINNMNIKCDHLDKLLGLIDNDGKPMLIASAGPSLEMQIELLEKNKKKFTIICVGSAFRTLIEHNIIPSMVVIIDPKPIVEYQFKNFDYPNVPLCFTATASKEAVAAYKGFKYIFNTKEDKNMIETGGTVGVAALSIAIKMKAKEILLLGQDLAFIEDKSHVSAFEKNYGLKDDFYNNLKKTKIKGVSGKLVETTQIYITFKNKLESVIRRNRGIKFVNISKGAAIEGAITMGFQEYLNE